MPDSKLAMVFSAHPLCQAITGHSIESRGMGRLPLKWDASSSDGLRRDGRETDKGEGRRYGDCRPANWQLADEICERSGDCHVARYRNVHRALPGNPRR